MRNFFFHLVQSTNLFSAEKLGKILLFVVPLFLMFWPGGVWIVQALLILAWFITLDEKQRGYVNAVSRLRRINFSKYFFAVVIGYFIWSVISITFLKSTFQSIDNSIIFFIWCLMTPLFNDLKLHFVILGYGCLLALILALALALTQFHFLNLDRAFGFYGNGRTGSGAIKFGDMALLFGSLTFLFLNQTSKNKLLGKLGVILGMLICIYASSRGGLLAIALCILVWQFNIRTNRYHGFNCFC